MISQSGLNSSGRHPEIGSLFADRFRILELIGRGGMGAVYRAEHVHMGRAVALKMLLGDLSEESQALKRFQQESRAISMLDHPNIVDVFDFGIVDEGLAYLSMDFISGCSLDAILALEPVLPPARFEHIFVQCCDALEHAHQNGVVHRDIKPSNIMLTKRGEDADFVKLVDFGLVKLVSSATNPNSEQKLTSSQVIVGSPLFMSPEQCRGLDVDHRTDIYSLGCVMYRALSGTLPHAGATPIDTFFKHISEDPTPILEVNPKAQCSPELETVIFKALSKEPADRQQSMAQLREELVAAIHAKPNSQSAPAPNAPPKVSTSIKRKRKKKPISGWYWVGASFLLVMPIVIALSLHLFAKKHHEIANPISTAPPVAAPPSKPTVEEQPKRINKPIEKSVAKPITKPVSKPVSQPAPQAVTKPVSQPISYTPPSAAVDQRGQLLQEVKQYSDYGDAHFANGNYQQAVANWNKSLELQTRLYGANSPELYPTLLKMAKTSGRMRDLQSAQSYWLRAIQVTESMPVQNQNLRYQYASFLRNHHQFEEADRWAPNKEGGGFFKKPPFGDRMPRRPGLFQRPAMTPVDD